MANSTGSWKLSKKGLKQTPTPLVYFTGGAEYIWQICRQSDVNCRRSFEQTNKQRTRELYSKI